MVSLIPFDGATRHSEIAKFPGPPDPVVIFPDSPGFHIITLPAIWEWNTSMSKLYKFQWVAGLKEEVTAHNAMVFLKIENCSGPNGTMTVYEGAVSPPPKHVLSFHYHGQSIIALGGTQSYSSDKEGNVTSRSWSGMENATMDLRSGAWNYSLGFLIQKQTGQNFGRAELSFIYIIPEPEMPGGSEWAAGGGGRRCKG